jgi:NAD(P)-dependent dehydrogenase (short-subunit alcohol dehydrogenase family)
MTDPPRTALVTGGARRIGRAIVLGLAGAGYGVVVHYRRSRDEAEALAGEIRETGGRAAVVAGDLAREDETATLIARAADALGPIDVLVNNASVFERDEALTATRESWDAHMEVNLRAPFALTQAFARALPDGIEGSVINLLDQRVANPTPHFTSYTVSKAGLWMLTRTLALALAPRVRVNGIAPGPVLPSRRQSAEQFRRQARATPLGRAADPAEIAETVLFLLAARSVTGQMIALDGGQHLNWSPPPAAPAAEE